MLSFNAINPKQPAEQGEANLKSQLFLIIRAIVLFLLTFTLPAIAASPGGSIAKVKFTTDQHSMVYVPVNINGAGPFNFLLDTGDTTTIIDQDLANQLSLPLIGQKEVITVETKLHVSIARSVSISIAGHTIRNLNLNVLARTHALPEGVRGILGEDFLGNFDLLIDNRHHVVQLQLGVGPMSDMYDGERLPVRLEGHIDGDSFKNRLIIAAYSGELSQTAISLQLDSGANSLYLFGGADTLGAGVMVQRCVATTISNSSYQFYGYKKRIRQLHFGQNKLENVMAYALPRTMGTDTDGLLPTYVFQSIFISHSQEFVILNPSPKPIPGALGA